MLNNNFTLVLQKLLLLGLYVCYKSSNEEVILGITIDNKLDFHSHMRKMCQKPGQKKNFSQEYQHF